MCWVKDASGASYWHATGTGMLGTGAYADASRREPFITKFELKEQMMRKDYTIRAMTWKNLHASISGGR